MDLPSNAYSAGGIQFNIAPGQYVYTNDGLDLVEQFDPQSSTSTETLQVDSFNSVSNFVENQLQNATNIIATSGDGSNNAVTFSNVILLPSMNDDASQALSSVQFITSDQDTDNQFKYVVASDVELLNSFRPNNVDVFADEQSSGEMIITAIDVNASTDGINQSNVQMVNADQMNFDPHKLPEYLQNKLNDNEMLMQSTNGQQYRHVQNIFVDNGQTIYSSELIPTNIQNGNALPDISYLDQDNYHQNDGATCSSNTFPANFVDATTPSDQLLDQLIAEAEARLLFDDNDGPKIMHQLPNFVESNQNQYSLAISQDSNLLPLNREHERMIMENAIQPLLTAVSEFTAREEQFQSYLNKTEIPENISHTNCHINNSNQITHFNAEASTHLATNHKTIPNPLPPSMPKIENNNLLLERRESTNDEFVDINEMQFVHKNDGRPHTKNIIIKRTRRKKTTKRKNEELLVADKQVPTRALATLPTNYLYFDNQSGDMKSVDVLAKRDIPLRTQFGPFEGELKISTKTKCKQYRNSHQGYPLLFVGRTTYLDVSNENTSNWMRFVRLATDCQMQNVLLYEIDSKLYFKCCKVINLKQPLYVGYSHEYAEKYNLEILVEAKSEELAADKVINKSSIVRVEENSSKPTFPNEQASGIKPNASNVELLETNIDNTPPSPVKSKHRLNTGAIRKRKLELLKSARKTGPTVRYACCYCSKVFSKFLNYKKHTTRVHSVNIEHKRVTVDAELKRVTIEDSIESDKDGQKKGFDDVANINGKRWFVCQTCQTSFESCEELENHLKLSCDKPKSLSVQCNICHQFLQTPSALTMHLKRHIALRLFICPFCNKSYKNTNQFKEHVECHNQNGFYSCIHCDKKFAQYAAVRKHMRITHSTELFVCYECDKCFKSKYKLKEHSLSHSELRQFLCDDCGKQFKRKDKLKEHILRVHAKVLPTEKTIPIQHPPNDEGTNPFDTSSSEESFTKDETCSATVESDLIENYNTNDEGSSEEAQNIKLEDTTSDDDDSNDNSFQEIEPNVNSLKQCDKNASTQMDSMDENTRKNDELSKSKFQPKVPPTEYQRFIYKCHDCMLGFKRRGMLVNHMAKRHPHIELNSIHELNLPILKTERCFFCQYCDKFYKSSTKRKAHILKNHPGQSLPQSTRNEENEFDNPNVPNASYSRSVSSTTMNPYRCEWCHKQYASHTRLVQHKRRDHNDQKDTSYNTNDYFREHVDSQYQFNYVENGGNLTDFNAYNGVLNVNPMNVGDAHQFNNICYEENKLLKLSSAALEASIRDELTFLNSDENIMETGLRSQLNTNNANASKVDVNLKVVADEFIDTSVGALPQLFEGIDCMSLKPTHFSTTTNNRDNHLQYLQ